MQDTLLDAVEAALLDVVAASAELLPVLVVGRAAAATGTGSTTPRWWCTAAACSGVAPKSYLPTYREFYERRQMAPGDDVRGTIRIGDAGGAVRAGPAVRRDRPARVRAARRDLRGHVGAGAAQRRGRAGRGDRAGQPVRQPDHRRPRRGPHLLCPLGVLALPGRLRVRGGRGGRVEHRPGLGRPDHDLRERRAARPVRALPEGAAALGRRRRPRTCCAPSGCGWAPSTTTGATTPDAPTTRSAASSSALDPPDGDIGLRRDVERFPFVPADPQRLRTGLLRGLQHPGLRAGAAAAGDRTTRRS